MTVPPAENTLQPFIRETVWIFSLIALACAITANISQVWLLGQEPALLGSLAFCSGQTIASWELRKPKERRRLFRRASAALMMIGGAALQILQSPLTSP